MDSSSSDSSLGGELRFHVYTVLVTFGAAAVVVVLFWLLYKLTASARPQDMLLINPACAGAGVKAALPVFVHAAGAGGGEAGAAGTVECAVCLAEMRDGERGRLLPGCGHRFHVECIDRWFRANSTCPLCRAAVVAAEPSEVQACKRGSAPFVIVVQS